MAIADFLEPAVKDYAEQAKATYSAPIDTSKFTGRSFVAGEDPLQTQAINLAQQGVGSYQPFLSGFQTAQQQAQSAFENQRQAQQAAAGLQLAGGELGTGIGQLYGGFGVQAPTTQANLATQLSQLGVTQTAADQQAAQTAYQNAMSQFQQPYQQLSFQAGLLGGAAPSFMQASAPGMGNPLLQGISALGGYAG